MPKTTNTKKSASPASTPPKKPKKRNTDETSEIGPSTPTKRRAPRGTAKRYLATGSSPGASTAATATSASSKSTASSKGSKRTMSVKMERMTLDTPPSKKKSARSKSTPTTSGDHDPDPTSTFMTIPWINKIALQQGLVESGYKIKNEEQYTHEELVIMMVEDRDIKPSIISSIFTALAFSPEHGNMKFGDIDLTSGMAAKKSAAKRLAGLVVRIANKKANLNKDEDSDNEEEEGEEEASVPYK